MNGTVFLACEGNDCYYFFKQAFKDNPKINVFDVGGNEDSAKFRDIKNISDYSAYETVVYVRDSEYPGNGTTEEIHYKSVIDRIKERFESIGLTAPDKPFEISLSGDKKCGYIILTGSPDSLVGTLEDLCVSIAVDKEAVLDGNDAIDKINKNRNNKLNKHRHKRLFQCVMAFNGNHSIVGAKTGQAVERKAFDLNSENFKRISDFLNSIT